MKKIFALIFATIFAGTLFCACGENDVATPQKYIVFMGAGGFIGSCPSPDPDEKLACKNFALGLYYKKLNAWLEGRFSSGTFFTEKELGDSSYMPILLVSASDFEKRPYDYWNLLAQTASDACIRAVDESGDEFSIAHIVQLTRPRDELAKAVEISFSRFEQKMAEIENEKFQVLRRQPPR